jgi:hypothetical protein
VSKLFLIIGATVVVLGGINAKAEERPAFERFGFPITQTQIAVLGSAGVRERSPTPTLMLYGMPASRIRWRFCRHGRVARRKWLQAR